MKTSIILLLALFFNINITTTQPLAPQEPEVIRYTNLTISQHEELISFDAFKEELKSFLNVLGNQLNEFLIDANATENYSACRIVLTEKLILNLICEFSDRWAYTNIIRVKLEGVVYPNITVGELRKSWSNIFYELFPAIQKNDPSIKKLYQQWLLSKKIMREIKTTTSFKNIITKEMLNQKDVAFVEHKDAYVKKMQDWYNQENSALNKIMFTDLAIITQNLDQHQNLIRGSWATSALKDSIIKEVKARAVGELTIDITELVDAVQDAVFKYEQLYLTSNGLAFKNDFFYTNYLENKKYFQLPTGFDQWLLACSDLKEREAYLAAFDKWHTTVAGIIATLKSQVPNNFVLDKAKFEAALTPLLNFNAALLSGDKAYILTFLKNYLLEDLKDKTNLKDLAKFWRNKMDAGLFDVALKTFPSNYAQALEHGGTYYFETLNLFNILPKTQELLDAFKASQVD